MTINVKELFATINFQRLMIEVLNRNAHKGTWQQGFSADEALTRLREEVDELDSALGNYHGGPGTYSDEQRRQIASEAADVANFAMMIADICGGVRRG